jgi:molybdopterin-containing oxidoreductase family membrane subunit
MVPIFLTSATASGVALLLLVAYALQKARIMQFTSKMFRSLSTLLGTVMIIDLFLLVVEILAIFWPTSAQPGHAIRFGEFLWGKYAWAFLPVLILGFSAFFLISRRKTRHLPAVQITAAGMYVLAIYFKRFSLMAMGFSITSLGQDAGMYVPSLVEIGIAGGLVAFGVLFMTISSKVLPLRVPEDDHDPAHDAQELPAKAAEPEVAL